MASTARSSDPYPSLRQAVLLTVLYGDLFEAPLTAGEIHRFLPVPCTDRAALERELAELDGDRLSRVGDLICWRGREATVAVRERRRRLAEARWSAARRFARRLRWVPFLRMVAVCGSQAMENGDEDGDVDLFLITAPHRLWLAQSLTMVLRRGGGRLGIEICPNYLVSEDALETHVRNFYTAREAAQAVPLWGASAYLRFQDANRWIRDFQPQLDLDDRRRYLEEPSRPRLTAWLETLLSGRLGDAFDRGVHRGLLVYYRWRLRSHGWDRDTIERAYRRDRQMVITGGYAATVAERFIDRCAAELADELSRDDVRRWFFGDRTSPRSADATGAREVPDPLYAGLMATRYGGGR